MSAYQTFGRTAKAFAVSALMMSVAPAPLLAADEGAASWPVVASAVKADAAIEARVSEILAKMSVEEKVGQVMQAEIQFVTPDDIRKYHLGSVLNGGGSLPNKNKHATPGEWLALADSFYEASVDTADGGVAVPIIWGSDAVHGHNNVIGATLFPHNIGLGAMHDPALIRKIGEVTAREVRATGIDWTFAPTVAVARNDRWGRTYESYSEDPALVKAYAREMVLGLQGEPGTPDFLNGNHVIATAKHFLADGGTTAGDDQGNAEMPEKDLRDIHAPGYFSALEAGAQSVMASFSSWNGTKMHGNPYLLTDVLKDRMGFDGFIVGDWNGHGQVPGCTNVSCAASINAGLDLFMVPEDWKGLYEHTLAQVKAGDIPMKRLDDAVARMLRVKLRAGLFDGGKPSTRGVAGRDDVIGSPEHRAVARQAVRQSLVLLKNAGGVLPIKPSARILVTGDGADNIGKQSGGWTISWQGTGNVNSDFPGATSIYGGIADAVKAAGGIATLSDDGFYKEKPDVAVVVFGEEPYAEGQGDRDTLEFEPGSKRALATLRKLKAEGVPVVSVFLSGRPMWVNPEINASDAFVAAWLPGSEGGGVADVLIADANGKPRHDFTGRLSFSWPKTPMQDNLNKGQKGYDPQFALGYGLDYKAKGKGPGKLAEDVAGVKAPGMDDIPLYVGRPLAPWLVFIADDKAGQQLSGAYAALRTGTARANVVDKNVQGDALLVEWLTGEKAALALRDGPALDWSGYYTAGATLTFELKTDKPGAMTVGFGCGPDCGADVSLAKVQDIGAADASGWRKVSVPLVCLADSARNFSHVTEPFRLSATGVMKATVANITIDLTEEGVKACPFP
ncbi:glycoside hydrolase family 3 protein [Pseudokordiimonas caeni]|uniref:glycoside hydrolase family 3 protein n=1 Tax=Pseudokordiimonas caeni TaxID=2997908 RepID=UPI0028124DF0|nr:glycoside hydrolase family 3 N-terminal domain-containing protein [Pseudokordiimonas caeni]